MEKESASLNAVWAGSSVLPFQLIRERMLMTERCSLDSQWRCFPPGAALSLTALGEGYARAVASIQLGKLENSSRKVLETRWSESSVRPVRNSSK